MRVYVEDGDHNDDASGVCGVLGNDTTLPSPWPTIRAATL
jgi:hypothetical protein